MRWKISLTALAAVFGSAMAMGPPELSWLKLSSKTGGVPAPGRNH